MKRLAHPWRLLPWVALLAVLLVPEGLVRAQTDEATGCPDAGDAPVLVKLGEDGTTTLAEHVQALPAGRYRVERYSASDPADVDGDCVDDLTELNDLGNQNPVNPAAISDPGDGAVVIKDRAAFNAVAHQQHELKAVLFGLDTSQPSVYFIDADTYQAHYYFLKVLELDEDAATRVRIYYDPDLIAPDSKSVRG